jgi:hypothetical protein
MDHEPADERSAEVLSHSLVTSVIDETMHNLAKSLPKEARELLRSELVRYAESVTRKIFAGDTPLPDFLGQWREVISDAVFELLEYPEFSPREFPQIAKAVEGLFGDILEELEGGLWHLCLGKITYTVGGAAYLVKLRLVPELLREPPTMSREELLDELKEIASKQPDSMHIVAG